MAKEAGKSAMSKRKKKSKHGKVREMHIKPGASGGYIVRHDEEPDADDQAAMAGGGQPSPQFALGDQQALHDHIDEHMPDQGAAPMGAPAPAAGGAPMGGAPAPGGM